MKKSYSEMLKDPRWQKRRLEILNRDKWSCQICGDDKKTLHVHHRRYLSGREPWDIPDELLVTLCFECHEGEEGMEDSIHDLVAIIKEKFFSHDVDELSKAFHSLKLPHLPEVFASALSYWFNNPELTKEIVDRYFEHLNNKNPDLL
jgi:hypothetical protein